MALSLGGQELPEHLSLFISVLYCPNSMTCERVVAK